VCPLPLETLQGTYRGYAKKVTLPRLLPNEQIGSVDSVKFGRIYAITAWKAVFENLVFIHEDKSSSSLNKRHISINYCVVWINKGELGNELAVCEDRCFTSHVSGELKVAS
jgi:hypothetical protein